MTTATASFQLLSWQEIGARWLAAPIEGTDKHHKMLLDDPGLGKTPQACGGLRLIGATSALVICPAPHAVKQAWKQHIVDWCGVNPDDIIVINSGKQPIPVDARWIIVSYELLQNEQVLRNVYHGKMYDAVIVDEAQYLKEMTSSRTRIILGNGDTSLISRGKYKWLLSGSIMPNRPIEVFPACRTLAPEILGPFVDYDKFGAYFCNGKYDPSYRGYSHIPELRQILKKFALRRTMEQVYKQIPPAVETDLYIDLGTLASGADETNENQAVLRQEIGLAKVPYTVEYLEYLRQTKNKIVVFFYHQSVGEALAKHFDADMYYGKSTAKQKRDALYYFIEGQKPILLMQYQAGGIALNGLQTVCNDMVQVEPDWSGGGYNQVVGRLKRIGQKHPVNVVLLIAKNTLDETIAAVRRRKQRTMVSLLDNLKPDNTQIEKENNDMMEQQLERIAVALEGLLAVQLQVANLTIDVEKQPPKSTTPTTKAAAATAASPSPAAAATQAAKSAEKVTADMVRDIAKEVLVALGGDDAARVAVKEIIVASGGQKVNDLKAKGLAQAYAMYEAKLASLQVEAEEGPETDTDI